MTIKVELRTSASLIGEAHAQTTLDTSERGERLSQTGSGPELDQGGWHTGTWPTSLRTCELINRSPGLLALLGTLDSVGADEVVEIRRAWLLHNPLLSWQPGHSSRILFPPRSLGVRVGESGATERVLLVTV
jgi:hypothetical protein